MHILAISAGTALLIYGADRFVIGASATARNFGLSPMLIGLTIVAFATSAPEILVSVTAALKGASDLAVGNAIGSNIANIGLVLGTAALVKPIMISNSTALRREMPVLVTLSLASILVFYDDYLGRIDAAAMLLTLCIFVVWIVRVSINDGVAATNNTPAGMATDTIAAEFDAEIPKGMPTLTAFAWLALGLALLLGGANLMVWGAEHLARALGISELIIGLTVVAIGTSLPELAVTVTSAYRGEAGLAIGNIVGSNIYNLLAVIGIAGMVEPSILDPDVLRHHFPVMVAFTVVLYGLAYNYRKSGEARITRKHGALLIVAFVAYHLNNLT
jgi:cation:H+ antiporter